MTITATTATTVATFSVLGCRNHWFQRNLSKELLRVLARWRLGDDCVTTGPVMSWHARRPGMYPYLRVMERQGNWVGRSARTHHLCDFHCIIGYIMRLPRHRRLHFLVIPSDSHFPCNLTGDYHFPWTVTETFDLYSWPLAVNCVVTSENRRTHEKRSETLVKKQYMCSEITTIMIISGQITTVTENLWENYRENDNL